MKDPESVLLVPNALCGEVGEPLHPDIRSLIQVMVNIGYWPLAFGENSPPHAPEHTELIFISDAKMGKSKLKAQADHFINTNGGD